MLDSQPRKRPERVTIIFLLALSWIAAAALYRAAEKHLWFDELFTYIVARQAPADQWTALEKGIDAMPPPFYLISAAGFQAGPRPEIGLRMMPLAGCVVMQVALFVLVRRKAGALAGLFAALIPAVTTARIYYIEARPYGLVLGFVALALVFWPRLDRKPAAAGFAAALLLAVFCHYYAVFAVFSFAAAEGVRTVMRKEIRWTAWLSFAGTALPFVICWHLIARFRELYGPAFWAKPTLRETLTSFDLLLNLPHAFGLSLVALLAAAAFVAIYKAWRMNDPVWTEMTDELLAGLFLLAVPLFGLALAKATAGAYTHRYVLPAILGVSVSGGLLAAQWRRTGQMAAATFLLLIVVRQEAGPMLRLVTGGVPDVAVPPGLKLVTETLDSELDKRVPIVISSGLAYMPIAHYAPPDYGSRIAALADPGSAIRTIQTDTVDRALLVARDHLPARIFEPQSFLSKYPRFYVYSDGDKFDRWPAVLLKEGYTLQTVQVSGTARTYLVDRRGLPQTPRPDTGSPAPKHAPD